MVLAKTVMAEQPIQKFTLKEWVRHPTTILLTIVTAVAWGVLWIYVNSQLSQVDYLKKRIEKLEGQVDKYTNTIMFKDATEKELKGVIIDQKRELDSLKGGLR